MHHSFQTTVWVHILFHISGNENFRLNINLLNIEGLSSPKGECGLNPIDRESISHCYPAAVVD